MCLPTSASHVLKRLASLLSAMAQLAGVQENPYKLFLGGLWRGTDKAHIIDLLKRLDAPEADGGIHIVFRVSIKVERVLKGLLAQGVLASHTL